MNRTDVLGVGFDDISPEQAVSYAYSIIQGNDNAYIVTPNPEIVWECRTNPDLSAAVNNASLVLPDGIGIIIAAKLLGTPIKSGRVPGIDFGAALFHEIAKNNRSVFLYGAKPGVASEAGARLEAGYPGLRIAGTADGYDPDTEQIIGQIDKAAPDLLLVCLGAPKQELWMANHVKKLNVRLCIGLGGALDVLAGRKKRAPVFFRKLGLEWLYRIIGEPRRIKRAFRLPMFLLAVLWKRIRGK